VVCVLLYVEGHTSGRYSRYARECACSRLRRETHGWAEVEHLDTSTAVLANKKRKKEEGRNQSLYSRKPPPPLNLTVRYIQSVTVSRKLETKKERIIRKSLVLQKPAPRA